MMGKFIAATLPMMSFGAQSHSKFQHFTFLGQKLEIETVCFENLKLNLDGYYS